MVKISSYQHMLTLRLTGEFWPSGNGILCCADLPTKTPRLTLRFSVRVNPAMLKNELLSPVLSFQLSFSPTTPMSSHGRVLSLLIAMLLSCCGLAVVCCVTGYTHGMHTLAFMAAEVRYRYRRLFWLCSCVFSKKLEGGWQMIFHPWWIAGLSS